MRAKSPLTGATTGSVTTQQNIKNGDSSSAKNPSNALASKSHESALKKN
jgi:hypothetical protein